MYKTIVTNRKAYYEYHVIETLTAGVKLLGSEIKPIKKHSVSLNESYCYVSDGELFIKGMYIAPNSTTNHFGHDSNRDKKLLVKKKEIQRLAEKVGEKGLTIIPLHIVLTDSGFVKIVIGLCKGKNVRDKSITIKIRDLDRELKKDLKKNFGD
jgi:SsrA-binding protein